MFILGFETTLLCFGEREKKYDGITGFEAAFLFAEAIGDLRAEVNGVELSLTDESTIGRFRRRYARAQCD